MTTYLEEFFIRAVLIIGIEPKNPFFFEEALKKNDLFVTPLYRLHDVGDRPFSDPHPILNLIYLNNGFIS